MDRLSSDTTFQNAFRGFENWLKDNIRAHIGKTKRIHGLPANLGTTLQTDKKVQYAYREHVKKCERDSESWDESTHECWVSGRLDFSFNED